ncbi:uncharacterized protein LTR77_000714 [Saxophila tyrrhenica]|uniref:DUF7082 domain-containing protein n=1 Tax=Saxophila tyrrhenica TaxID=1690608 RepID=A0AAV9PQ20_9PEZI|nr:hypothetical protein LTR77_000714 [Saxophila tyrrhenica]
MSDYDNKQHYDDVYEYPTSTRPEHGQGYSAFAAHPTYTNDYVTTQAEVPSGLPHSVAAYNRHPAAQTYASHDTAYYHNQQVHYPAYLETASRPLPEITSYSPNQGQRGTRVTVYLRSVYDLDLPQVTPMIMFGPRRCESQSVLTKTTQHGQPYHYALTVDAPPLTPTASPSPQVPLTLTFDESPVTWSPTSFEFGSFTYLDQQPLYPVLSPPAQQKKRKLSPEASPRRSPTKKQSLQHLAGPSSAAHSASPFRRPSVPDLYSSGRRLSVPEVQQSYALPRVSAQQYYAPQPAPSYHSTQSPSWNYMPHMQSVTRSPSTATMAAGTRSLAQASPTINPPLIRTSTLQQSPTTPASTTSASQFNPHAMYLANTKAVLKIEGDLNSMADKWTPTEHETGRRLVQFRRKQEGSVITANFEPVTLEDRIPNSICVSCIWWEERHECYVTSVDTISLLESLVAVRFTVEEKNRIRRNLEGFRPATVSKTKPDSEGFFKLIMGFPNPKPRNIEKDVKVFPWRILAGALKKIIGKYSASYSSTAGALHTPGAGASSSSYSASRASEIGLEHPHSRPIASPHSTSSSATSHGNAYAANMATSAYALPAMGPTGLGIGPSAGPPSDLRLTVPTSATHETTSWHQPSAHYSSDLSATRGSWDYPHTYLSASPATGLPSSAQSYQFANRIPSLSAHPGIADTARFVPLQQYEDHQQQQGHPTPTG